MRDLRFAFRVLRNHPAFTAVAIATLGLGIAANTTVFGWIDTVLLRPIPGVSHAHELTALEEIAPDGERLGQCPHPDFRDFQRSLTLASGVVASHLSIFTIGPPNQPVRAMGQVVSANFFDVLGVKPYLGRMFSTDEDRGTSERPVFATPRRSGFGIATRPIEIARKGRLVEMGEIQRGEIWWADLPEPRRSEPGFRRGVLVVQADSFNLSRIQTAIVAAITSNMAPADAPGNVLLPERSAGLARDSARECCPTLDP